MTVIFSTRGFGLFAAFVVALCCALPARANVDEIADFKKYFRQYKDTPTRVEAVMALESVDSPGVVETLLPVLKLTAEPDVVRAAVRVLSQFKKDESKLALFTELDTSKDETVRVGLLQAMTLGKYSGAGEILQKLLTDKAWDLRRRAVEALIASGDKSAAAAIAPLCLDPEPATRCAALEGLAQWKATEVLPAALESLSHPAWQVRASAIYALKHVRSRDSIEPLIARMALEEGRLTADIGDALNEITGRSFGLRLELWQKFWNDYKSKFQIPTDEEIAKLRARQREEAARYKPEKGGTSYHGIETPSRRIMFIIDVSGSMENLVVEKERFQDGGYPTLLRIDICKTELIRTIESLEAYVDFNVIAFATEVRTWKKDLVKANVLNKSNAADWVRKLEALGGASKEDLAEAGLTGSANLDAGKTNTYGALSTALGVGPPGTKVKDYTCSIDTLFFLSDGRPTVGEYVEPQDVLREIRAANSLRKVVIHTIAIGEFQKDFMKQLADENFGIFVDLGR